MNVMVLLTLFDQVRRGSSVASLHFKSHHITSRIQRGACLSTYEVDSLSQAKKSHFGSHEELAVRDEQRFFFFKSVTRTRL